jgi:biotin operon repressor
MAKKARSQFVQGMGILNLLSDQDWIVILAALAGDRQKSSQDLCKSLMMRTKHGRQVRLLKLISEKQPTVPEMQKAMKISRRTVFRDLNSLEGYGIELQMDDGYRYSVKQIPALFKRLL